MPIDFGDDRVIDYWSIGDWLEILLVSGLYLKNAVAHLSETLCTYYIGEGLHVYWFWRWSGYWLLIYWRLIENFIGFQIYYKCQECLCIEACDSVDLSNILMATILLIMEMIRWLVPNDWLQVNQWLIENWSAQCLYLERQVMCDFRFGLPIIHVYMDGLMAMNLQENPGIDYWSIIDWLEIIFWTPNVNSNILNWVKVLHVCRTSKWFVVNWFWRWSGDRLLINQWLIENWFLDLLIWLDHPRGKCPKAIRPLCLVIAPRA